MAKLPKDQTISFRVTGVLKNQVAAVEETTGSSISDMLVQATQSIVDLVGERGYITMPFRVLPEVEFQALTTRIQELEKQVHSKQIKKSR